MCKMFVVAKRHYAIYTKRCRALNEKKMGLFNFSKKKAGVESETNGLNDEKELNLFQDSLESPEFLKKIKNLKDINKKFQKGLNLLHFAAEYGELKLATELLDLGIKVDEKNDFGNTPLWTAVFNANGNYELVELLLKHGANPNSVNNADNTPLKFAETIQDEELIKKLKTHYNKV